VRYIVRIVIKTFRCKETGRLYRERVSGRRFRSFAEGAYRKLIQLDEAGELRDLQGIPGNRLEKLSGGRQGQYSIRINDRWRICFRWEGGDAYDVEIIDYH
jgi:proteic killer suppression protein